MNTTDLKSIINNAKKVINKKSSVSKLRAVKIKDGFLTVADEDMQYSQKIDIDEKLNITTEFVNVEKLANKLPKNKEVSFVEKDDCLNVLYLKSKFSYPNEGEDGFINYELNDLKEVDLLKADQIKEIKKTAQFTANDELRPVMNGVYIDESGEIVASDSHIMRYKDIKHNIKDKLILKTKFVNSLHDSDYVIHVKHETWKNSDGKEFTRATHVMFSNESEVYIHKFIEGKYVNWRAVIPTSFYTKVEVDKTNLLEALKLAELTSNKHTDCIQLISDESNTKIFSSDFDNRSESETYIRAKHEGDYSHFGFKNELMSKCIKSIDDENIKIQIVDNSRASIINDECLIMPMSIS